MRWSGWTSSARRPSSSEPAGSGAEPALRRFEAQNGDAVPLRFITVAVSWQRMLLAVPPCPVIWSGRTPTKNTYVVLGSRFTVSESDTVSHPFAGAVPRAATLFGSNCVGAPPFAVQLTGGGAYSYVAAGDHIEVIPGVVDRRAKLRPVQLLAAYAHRVFRALIGAGNEPVERHRDPKPQSAHITLTEE